MKYKVKWEEIQAREAVVEADSIADAHAKVVAHCNAKTGEDRPHSIRDFYIDEVKD